MAVTTRDMDRGGIAEGGGGVGNWSQDSTRGLGGRIGQGGSLRQGGGDRQRIHINWGAVTDPCISAWCALRVNEIKSPFMSATAF